MKYTKNSFGAVQTEAIQYEQGLRSYMLQIYNFMAMALLLTGLVAVAASSSSSIMSALYRMDGRVILGMAPMGYLVMFAPLVLVWMLSSSINNMSVEKAQMLFWLYAGLMGLSLSSIFLIYTGASIARVFFIAASVFGGMSLYGYTTKKDLTNFGSFLIMGLLAIMIASIVNLFIKSSGFQFMLSLLGSLIFIGLTAYDTQKMKAIYYQQSLQGEAATKVAILGALALYMDFLNIFLHLLQFFGDRRND